MQVRSAPRAMSRAMGKYKDSKRWTDPSKVISFQNNTILNTQGYQKENLGTEDRERWPDRYSAPGGYDPKHRAPSPHSQPRSKSGVTISPQEEQTAIQLHFAKGKA